jgi:hypothetical protein
MPNMVSESAPLVLVGVEAQASILQLPFRKSPQPFLRSLLLCDYIVLSLAKCLWDQLSNEIRRVCHYRSSIMTMLAAASQDFPRHRRFEFSHPKSY